MLSYSLSTMSNCETTIEDVIMSVQSLISVHSLFASAGVHHVLGLVLELAVLAVLELLDAPTGIVFHSATDQKHLQQTPSPYEVHSGMS